MEEREGRAECEREEAQPVDETAAGEGHGVPLVLAREVVAVQRNDEEVVQLVPDRASEGFHDGRDGGEGEGDDGLEDAPELVLLVDDLVEEGFKADELDKATLSSSHHRTDRTSSPQYSSQTYVCLSPRILALTRP